MRQVMVEALREAGFSVAEVGSGDMLLSHLKTALLFEVPRRPDVIVTDLRMPGRSGIEVLTILDCLDPRIPVVIVTGSSDFDLSFGAFGVVRVLTKPVDLDELTRVVRDAIEASHPS
jgi:two-component system nitrogen regulation response regulator GlnG